MVKKIYFPASQEEVSGLKINSSYDEKRLAVFTCPQALLDVISTHPTIAYHAIVELDVPADSLRDYPKDYRKSFGPKSGAVVTNIYTVNELEEKLLLKKKMELVWQSRGWSILLLPFFYNTNFSSYLLIFSVINFWDSFSIIS